MLSEKEEDIFLKKLLKKYHTENSKKEIKRKKINPSKKKQRFFFEALAYEENYGGIALKKEEVNDENKEKIFTLKNGIKIIYKYEKNTVDLNDIKAKLSKIEKYDNDIMAEYFYHYGLLKKIIYYNKDRSINNINYFDIYYSIQTLHGISFINSDFLLEKNKYFKVKTLKEKDIKIYEKTDCKFNFLGNYPSNTLNKNSEALSLKILKDNIEIDQRDIKSFIGKLKSFPTITEYYSNNKIIKKDIYKVERIVFSSEIFNKNIILIGKLEKTEYFNENNEVEKVKKINEYIHLRNAFWAAYIPRIEYYFQEKVPELFVEENFIEQEEKFLKGLLEKFRTKNPKEKINLEEEIKRLEGEIKRMEEENPHVIEEAEKFWQNLSFEDDDGNDLESEGFNTEKTERVYSLKNKTKIIYKYDKNTVDLDDCEDKLSKIEKYNKDGKIEVECFYHYGFLKKIIYYNEDQTINNIDYFDIYYNEEETSLSYIYSSFHFFKLDKYFETKSLKESDIKICVDTEYGSKFLENYPSDMIKAKEESLILRTLKENIKIERKDIKEYINYFESFPTITEYYSNGKIIKKDIYKVERIMEISDSAFFHTNVRLRGVLEKTEYYNKCNKMEKIEEINRYIHVVEAEPDFWYYLPKIKF